VALIFVFTLTQLMYPSLYYLAVAYGTSLIISNITLTLWFYNKRRELVPTLTLNSQHIRPIMSLGLQFFIIQLACLVIFTTDKMLITQIFGAQYVTQYDVVFKLFGIITLFYSLISAPLWSSYTDAYQKKDFIWITNILIKQLQLFIIIIICVIVVIFMIVISVWSNIFAFFVNGLGKIKLQLYTSIIAMVINLPLAIYFTKQLGFGIEGIMYATCISLSIFALAGPVQTYLIFKNDS
jgi:O-antigen/teichoic acid export membrane protein